MGQPGEPLQQTIVHGKVLQITWSQTALISFNNWRSTAVIIFILFPLLGHFCFILCAFIVLVQATLSEGMEATRKVGYKSNWSINGRWCERPKATESCFQADQPLGSTRPITRCWGQAGKGYHHSASLMNFFKENSCLLAVGTKMHLWSDPVRLWWFWICQMDQHLFIFLTGW